MTEINLTDLINHSKRLQTPANVSLKGLQTPADISLKEEHTKYTKCNCVLDHIRMDKRPCFMINGMEYVSAGIFFWTEKMDDEQLIYNLLLQKTFYPEPPEFHNSSIKEPFMNTSSKDNYVIEDFGGKSDITDKCIQAVAVRECLEELNFKINESELVELINSDNVTKILIPECKYILYLVHVKSTYMDIYNSSLFGTEELHEHITRTVMWLSYKDYINEHIKGKLNPRLSKCTDDILLHMMWGT